MDETIRDREIRRKEKVKQSEEIKQSEIKEAIKLGNQKFTDPDDRSLSKLRVQKKPDERDRSKSKGDLREARYQVKKKNPD